MFTKRSDKRVFLLGIPFVCLTTLAIGAAVPANETGQVIRDLEEELSDAVVAGDAAVFDRLLADDFTHTSHSGRFRNKAEWMADLRRGATKYTTFKTDDMSVRVYGDTAVVTGRSTPTGTNSRGEPIEGQYRYLRVWVKHDGNWQVVAFQGTRIPETQPVEKRSTAKPTEKDS